MQNALTRASCGETRCIDRPLSRDRAAAQGRTSTVAADVIVNPFDRRWLGNPSPASWLKPQAAMRSWLT